MVEVTDEMVEAVRSAPLMCCCSDNTARGIIAAVATLIEAQASVPSDAMELDIAYKTGFAAGEAQARAEIEQWKGDYENQVDLTAELQSENDALRAELAQASAENERLRLAIMGGEDAPGYAMSLSADEIIEGLKKERRERDAWTDACVAQARAAAIEEAGERVRHKKRGSTYDVLGEAEVQCAVMVEEGALLTVYRCHADGKLWARPTTEFRDGRFEPLARPVSERQGDGKDWVVRKGGYFYRPNSQGYTVSIHEAGRYTQDEARAHAEASSGEVTAHPADKFLPTARDVLGILKEQP